MIQEYRKLSAEALGLKEGTVNMGQYAGMKWVKYPNGANIAEGWQPDKDANQREMIEDWLIKQGCRIIYEYKLRDKKWKVDIYNTFADEIKIDQSKSIAFMKAFMKYYSATRKAAK